MKIALPTRENTIDNHFGHCEYFTVLTLDSEKKEIIHEETIASPAGCGCKSNIAQTLQENGVTLMLAGNMGEGALRVLNNANIEVIRGCSGNIKEVALSWIDGQIQDSDKGCSSHDCHH